MSFRSKCSIAFFQYINKGYEIHARKRPNKEKK